MASIDKVTTKAGAKRYRVHYRVNGRKVERWFDTLAAARSHKIRVEGDEADEADGTLVDPRAGVLTLDEYFAMWLEGRLVKGRPVSPSTKLGYQRLYRRNVQPRIGTRQLPALRPDTIRTWHADVTATAGADQAAESYGLLRAVLVTAEADELLRQNPCSIRGAGEDHAVERPMVATELVLDLADTIEPRYRAMVLLAGFGGLRTGESLGLRRSDVDLLHSEVVISRQAQEVTGKGRVELPPKSAAGRRTVSLPAVVLDALEDHP